MLGLRLRFKGCVPGLGPLQHCMAIKFPPGGPDAESKLARLFSSQAHASPTNPPRMAESKCPTSPKP